MFLAGLGRDDGKGVARPYHAHRFALGVPHVAAEVPIESSERKREILKGLIQLPVVLKQETKA